MGRGEDPTRLDANHTVDVDRTVTDPGGGDAGDESSVGHGAVVMPRIPGYQVMEFVGSGGMSRVYRARQDLLHRTVAIKILRRSLSGQTGAIDQFIQEMRLVCRVDHPGVVAVYDAGIAGRHHYLAMEWLPGGDLADELHRSPGGLPMERVLAVGRTLAGALMALDEHGIVHRDIKPGNVLVDRHGHPKLADFGIAHHLRSDPRAKGTTERLVGSPPYMAPEQVAGSADIDVRTDCYGLGATLFTLATGRAPFVGETVREILKQVLLEAAPRVADLRPDVPAAFDDLVDRCLQKRAEDRIPDARALHQALDGLYRHYRSAQAAAVAVTWESDGAICTCRIRGTFGGAVARNFVDGAQEHLEPGLERLVVDCEAVDLLASDGLGALVTVLRMRPIGDDPWIALHRLKPEMAQSLVLVGLADRFEIG